MAPQRYLAEKRARPADNSPQTLNRRVPGQPEDDPVAFLRKYSNYLAPKLGVFSADFWVIFTIWIRNMLLNLLISDSISCLAYNAGRSYHHRSVGGETAIG